APVALILVGVLWGILLYNNLVLSRNRTREAWSGIDVQLKRRSSLIPNLVESVRGYARHEHAVFSEVSQARGGLANAAGPTAAEGGSHPVLVYNRIAHNRRKTWVLVGMSVAALAPFVLSLSYLLSAVVVRQVRGETRQMRAAVVSDRRIVKRLESSEPRTEWEQWVERDLEEKKEALAKLEAADWELMLKLMLVFGAASIAAMGILFWGISASPTS